MDILKDLLLYNSAEDFETRANVNAVLDYDGTVNFLPPGIFKSICQIQIFHFPFDAQACNLKFGRFGTVFFDILVNIFDSLYFVFFCKLDL